LLLSISIPVATSSIRTKQTLVEKFGVVHSNSLVFAVDEIVSLLSLSFNRVQLAPLLDENSINTFAFFDVWNFTFCLVTIGYSSPPFG
jgi:hypothetical protein